MFDVEDVELLGFEYEKARQLLLLKNLCAKMSASTDYESRIRKIFRQSHDDSATARALIRNEYACELDDADALRMSKWINARLRKAPTRKRIPREVKDALVVEQNGRCAICGEPVFTDSPDSHVDHIVPWVLVGDELESNYQVLCDDCNRKKSSDVSYIFKSMIQLN